MLDLHCCMGSSLVVARVGYSLVMMEGLQYMWHVDSAVVAPGL